MELERASASPGRPTPAAAPTTQSPLRAATVAVRRASHAAYLRGLSVVSTVAGAAADFVTSALAAPAAALRRLTGPALASHARRVVTGPAVVLGTAALFAGLGSGLAPAVAQAAPAPATGISVVHSAAMPAWAPGDPGEGIVRLHAQPTGGASLAPEHTRAQPAATPVHQRDADATIFVHPRSGDSLSSIAGRYNESLGGIEEQNPHLQRGGENWNLVYTTDTVRVTPGLVRPMPAQAVVVAAAAAAPRADLDSARVPAAPAPERAPASARVSTPAPATVSAPAGAGSFQACVINRESSGRSQVMNSSGHYGLYQFSASTWAASGGNPADFGHASVAEQNQVFAQAYARFGTSPWRPYDGC